MTDTRCTSHPGSLLDQIHIRKAERKDLHEMEWEGEYQRFRGVYTDVFARANRGLAIMWVAELEGGGLAGQAFVQLKMSDRSCWTPRRKAWDEKELLQTKQAWPDHCLPHRPGAIDRQGGAAADHHRP